MDLMIIILLCVGCVYTIYSLMRLLTKISKLGKENIFFKASLSQWIIHGSGILLLGSATLVFYGKGSYEGAIFFILLCNVIIDFITRNIRIKK